PEIIALDVERLLEQAPHGATTALKCRRRPRRDQRVDLSTLKHLRQRAVRGREAHGDSRRLRGLEWNPTVLLEPALDPFNIRGAHAVIVGQNAARPHRGRHLVLGYADAFASEVLRAAHPRSFVNEDARLPKEARRKNRDRDEVVGAAPAAHDISVERELRSIELPVLGHAPEDLLHAQHDVGQVDALGPDPTVAERLGPIIVARSQGQAQHVDLRKPLCTPLKYRSVETALTLPSSAKAGEGKKREIRARAIPSSVGERKLTSTPVALIVFVASGQFPGSLPVRRVLAVEHAQQARPGALVA